MGSEDGSAIERQFLRLADVIVVELMGHEQTARRVAIELARQPVSLIMALFHGMGARISYL